MEIGQLRAFVMAAREKSFTHAAELLAVTQPSVTARIQILEEELKLQLFLRKGRTIELTDGGKAFLPYAERTLSVLDEGIEAVRSVREGTGGRLAIGAIQTICLFLIAPVLDEFHRQNPQVEIFLRSGQSVDIVQMLLDDVVHLALALGPVIHPQIRTLDTFHDELIVIAGAQHPLTQRRTKTGKIRPVKMAELANEEFIVARWGSSFDVFMNRISDINRRPRMSMEISITETAKAMVKMNSGISLLPRFAVTNELQSGSLLELPVDDWEPLVLEVGMYHRRDRELTAPAQHFLELWSSSIQAGIFG
ncbi:MAG: LysR family transcriptional regulator [Chloroflexota bacterium]|nr:LysR family transcriptional regulator [Chloroflexota bacterium]